MKHLSRFLVISAALSVAAASQAVVLAGTATGTFDSNGLQTLAGLSYTDGAFNVMTDPATGFFAIGGNSLSDSFGLFSVDNTAHNYNGETFTLVVTFTSPPGVNPGSPAFGAQIKGSVSSVGGGGVKITFGPTQYFNFPPNGTFDLTLDDVSITPSRAGYVTGSGTAAPAPSALAAFGIGALGAVRRRRRASK